MVLPVEVRPFGRHSGLLSALIHVGNYKSSQNLHCRLIPSQNLHPSTILENLPHHNNTTNHALLGVSAIMLVTCLLAGSYAPSPLTGSQTLFLQ